MVVLAEILIIVGTFLVLIFFNRSLFFSTLIYITLLLAITAIHGWTLTLIFIWLISLSILTIFNFIPLRRRLITANVFTQIKKKLPTISKTEQAVLNAGNVWWEKELLTGRPNWQQLHDFPQAKLSSEEQQFLDHQVNILCEMLQDWEIINEGNLSQKTWDYIKKERFFGLVIPKKFGGHGFSAFAHSTIVMKIASRSYSAAINIMVPNSVGLAEFILHYGTSEQQTYYLPKLANGEEIPCFALTAPEAGSDAGAMSDQGIVTWGNYQDQKMLGVRLTWDKRYITLAPIATLIGLAFKLYDPEQLLGSTCDLGITLAMIPRHLPGITIGARHWPLGMAFLNGPIQGKNVFIPLDFLIGGSKMAGHGWEMMMECLSVGRGISLPALSTGVAKLAYRTTSAYVKVREQFHHPLGYFEGIKEALAQIGAFTYLCEATRHLTAAAIDQNYKPSITTAITKYHLSEMSRLIIDKSMDIHGGRAIQLGPSNYLGLYYVAMPISITVEGANILTRNLIIFGQGILRCHPYISQEVAALQDLQPKKALKKFDRLFFKHVGYVLSNTLRCWIYGLTRGRWLKIPVTDCTAKYYRQLTHLSVALAVVTDVTMGILGGELKQRERLSARLGDILSYLYLGSAMLKYYQDQGRPVSDLPFVNWLACYCVYQIVKAFNDFFNNFPYPKVAKFLQYLIFPWGNQANLPLDSQDNQLADLMYHPELRQRLAGNTYLGNSQDIVAKLEQTFHKILNAEGSYQKIHQAVKKGLIIQKTLHTQILAAKTAKILSDQEADQLLELEQLRFEVIQVDEFNAIIRNQQYGRIAVE